MTFPKQDVASLKAFYGGFGENQTQIVPPYQMYFNWAPFNPVRKITCHEKVADSLVDIFKDTLAEYGAERIHEMRLDRFAGCLNVRPMRGGKRPSTHCWGIAVDLADDHNRLAWGRDRALFAKPEYKAFWSIVLGHGWTSLGLSRDFDWMHFQAASL